MPSDSMNIIKRVIILGNHSHPMPLTIEKKDAKIFTYYSHLVHPSSSITLLAIIQCLSNNKLNY